MTEGQVTSTAHEDRVLPAVVYGLYLFGAFSALISVFIGLILAYVQRGSAGPRMETHYTFMIRTFWLTIWWFLIGVALIVVGAVGTLVLVGLPFLLVGIFIVTVVGLWFIVRCVAGLIYLMKDEAYPRPESWLF